MGTRHGDAKGKPLAASKMRSFHDRYKVLEHFFKMISLNRWKYATTHELKLLNHVENDPERHDPARCMTFPI